MLRSFLIGLVAGQRAMTPLAVVAGAARRGALPDAPPLLAHPLVAVGAAALAAAEMAGDKMKTAPDRTIPAGLVGRAITGAAAGAALAPSDERRLAATVAGLTAVAASFIGLNLRKHAMRRYGQTATGFVEDALVLGGGLAIATVRR